MKVKLPVDWLREDFEARKRKNSAYSMRAYARDLKVSQSILSLILNGKRGIGLNLAERLSETLNLSKREKKEFLVCVARAKE